MWVIQLEHHSPLDACTLVDVPCRYLGRHEGILFGKSHLGMELFHCNILGLTLRRENGGLYLEYRATH